MWTWERERRQQARDAQAQLGLMTLGGGEMAANLGSERRWLSVCAPGGYSWCPSQGDQVLVLKSDAGEKSCVMGTVDSGQELQPGQVRLHGGTCSILLGNKLELWGEVMVDGEKLEDYVRRIIATALGGG